MKKGIVILVAWTLFLVGVLLTPIGGRALSTFVLFEHWDKVAHSLLFLVTGIAGVAGSGFLSRFRSRILFAIGFGLSLAVGTEAAQSLVSARSASPYDLLADVLGLVLALGLCALFRRSRSA